MLKRKTMFLLSLVALLVVVGYINHKLIQISSNEDNTDYVSYEEGLIDLNGVDLDKVLEASSNNIENENDLAVVDSKEVKIADLTKQTNTQIDSQISLEENRKRLNYYVEYRLTRDKLRASLIENLQYIIDNANSTDEMKNESQNKIMELVDLSTKELFIEELVKSKGIDEALVFLNNDSARIVVEVDELNEKNVAKILDIVIEQTGLKASSITIMKRF